MTAATESRAPAVLTIGEPLIALIGRETGVPLVEVSGYGVHVTGAELNTAVGLARLGHRVALAGRVGGDPFGEIVRRRLLMEAVDTRWLVDDPRPTGMLFRNLRNTARAEVVYRRAGSAGSSLTVSDVEPALAALADDGLVLTTGVTAAVCPATTRAVVELTRAAGRRLCVDLNHRSRLWSAAEAAAGLRALAAGAFLVTASLDEARLVTGREVPGEAAQSLLEAGAEIVVLRHDDLAGSWFSADGAAPVVERAARTVAVDPVGAGDAFMAGLVSGILELGTEAPAACLRRAHLCGAAVVGAAGDLEGALLRDELDALEAGGGTGDEPLR